MDTLHIVKIGGNIIDDENKLAGFLQDFAQISGPKILVHGGGKIATELGKTLGIEARLVDGRRITDADTLRVVTMVYGGLINKNIVARLQAHNCNAIGLTGADANLIPAVKRPAGSIDYGFVGDILADNINTRHLQLLVQNNLTPIFAPLTHDGDGQLLNTNADTIAASLAIALAGIFKVQLIYCFEKKGVLEDVKDEASVIAEITPEKYKQLKTAGIISQGMLPKIDNALQALYQGVAAVYIAHAADVLTITNRQMAGTRLHL